MLFPRLKERNSANASVVYAVGVCIGALLIWQLFVANLLGLPAAYNTTITVALCVVTGAVVIGGLVLSSIQNVTLEKTSVRVRKGFFTVKAYTYDQIESIVPDGDKVAIVFKDSSQLTGRNLRFGDGMSLAQINSLVSDKKPGLSIFDAGEDDEK